MSNYGWKNNSLIANTVTVGTITATTLKGTSTGTSGLVLTDLKTDTAGSLSGTQLDVEIDVNGTPYYFTVYPTSS